jgi:hypothetical protein
MRQLLIGTPISDTFILNGSSLNELAGTYISGGDGADTIQFNASQAYTDQYVNIFGDGGDDFISAGTQVGQYIGSINIEGGVGNDTIEIGNVQGGSGYVNGGDGNDIIRTVGEWASSVAIWGNDRFELRGGDGNDSFILTGTQYNILGNDQGARIDGGNGFDTLVWNGLYQLSVGGNQNPNLFNDRQWRAELQTINIEQLDIASSGAEGFSFKFTSSDIQLITKYSVFDRRSLGLNKTGLGETLFIKNGDNSVDVSSWRYIGITTQGGDIYSVYDDAQSNAILCICNNLNFIYTPDFKSYTVSDLNNDQKIDKYFDGFNRLDDSVFLEGGAVTVFDANNDGVQELYKGVYNLPYSGQEYAALYYKNAAGGFDRSTDFSRLEIRGHTEQGTPFDYNNDGYLDLFIPRYAVENSENTIDLFEPGSIFLVNHNGNFIDETTNVFVSSPYAQTLNYFTDNFGRNPESAVPIDINLDGWVDLYVAGHLLINDTKGGFVDMNDKKGIKSEFDEGVVSGDFNNDGLIDIVRLLPRSGPELLLNKLDHFESSLAFFDTKGLVYDYTWGINAIDLNSDGFLDIVISGNSAGESKFFVNNGNITLPHFYSVSQVASFSRAPICVADFDGNGTQDFSYATNNYTADTYLNQEKSKFGSIKIGVYSSQGIQNQIGQIVRVKSTHDSSIIQSVIMQAASGYAAQNEYKVSLPLSTDGLFQISMGDKDNKNISVEFKNSNFISSSGWDLSIHRASTADDLMKITAYFDGALTNNSNEQKINYLYGGDSDDIISFAPLNVNSFTGSVIDGCGGNDTISTYAGSNIIRGGAGNDTISCGKGLEQLFLNSSQNNGVDEIFGFDINFDKIVINSSDYGVNQTNLLLITSAMASTTDSSNSCFIYSTLNQTLYFNNMLDGYGGSLTALIHFNGFQQDPLSSSNITILDSGTYNSFWG